MHGIVAYRSTFLRRNVCEKLTSFCQVLKKKKAKENWFLFLPHGVHNTEPGVGAVVVEYVELGGRDELAAVDARLNGTETAQNAHLLDIADDRRDVESLQLGVDGVQAAHEVLEEQLERLRQADELAAVHAERGDASAAVVDQAARVVLRVAGDGRWRVAGGRRKSRGAERHLLGSLVEQERAVVRGGGGVERDRRRRSEAGRPVERGAGGQRRQVVARDAEPERQRSVHDRRHPNNQPPTLGRPVTRCRVDERENVPLQRHPRSKSTDSIECSLSRLRTRSLGAAATATAPLQQTVVGTARLGNELSRCGETSARVATHRQPSYLVLRAPRSRQSDSAGRPLRSSAKAGPSRRPRLPSSLARRRRPALLNLLSTCVRPALFPTPSVDAAVPVHVTRRSPNPFNFFRR